MACYPLIDVDSKGLHKRPLFTANTEQVIRGSNDFYLSEESCNHYRLHAKRPHRMIDYMAYSIACPKCGKAMNAVASHEDMHRLAVYSCSRCYRK